MIIMIDCAHKLLAKITVVITLRQFKGPIKHDVMSCYVGEEEVSASPRIFFSSFCIEIPLNTAHTELAFN